MEGDASPLQARAGRLGRFDGYFFPEGTIDSK